jgi:hypothetical protein
VGFEEGDPQVALQAIEGSLTIEVVSYGNSCREKGELQIAVFE